MFLLIILSILAASGAYELDIHSCEPVEDRQSFQIVELNCKINKNGLFTYSSERPQLQNVRVVQINRVTEHSLVKILNVGQLQIIRVQSGQCSSIMPPESVNVYVKGHLCLLATSSVSIPLPPLKSLIPTISK